MAEMSVQLRSIQGTGAAVGLAGGHTIIVDRPVDKAGGTGLGFNGGQILALAIGGCFCNDLQYVSHEMGIRLAEIAVQVTLTLEGEPLIATKAVMTVNVTSQDASSHIEDVIRRAKATSTVSNSLVRGFPVETVVES
jgi:organic hydroperoxide reductase OsmC/OhrA